MKNEMKNLLNAKAPFHMYFYLKIYSDALHPSKNFIYILTLTANATTSSRHYFHYSSQVNVVSRNSYSNTQMYAAQLSRVHTNKNQQRKKDLSFQKLRLTRTWSSE